MIDPQPLKYPYILKVKYTCIVGALTFGIFFFGIPLWFCFMFYTMFLMSIWLIDPIFDKKEATDDD